MYFGNRGDMKHSPLNNKVIHKNMENKLLVAGIFIDIPKKNALEIQKIYLENATEETENKEIVIKIAGVEKVLKFSDFGF